MKATSALWTRAPPFSAWAAVAGDRRLGCAGLGNPWVWEGLSGPRESSSGRNWRVPGAVLILCPPGLRPAPPSFQPPSLPLLLGLCSPPTLSPFLLLSASLLLTFLPPPLHPFSCLAAPSSWAPLPLSRCPSLTHFTPYSSLFALSHPLPGPISLPSSSSSSLFSLFSLLRAPLQFPSCCLPFSSRFVALPRCCYGVAQGCWRPGANCPEAPGTEQRL